LCLWMPDSMQKKKLGNHPKHHFSHFGCFAIGLIPSVLRSC